jgi:hypothetical protein
MISEAVEDDLLLGEPRTCTCCEDCAECGVRHWVCFYCRAPLAWDSVACLTFEAHSLNRHECKEKPRVTVP